MSARPRVNRDRDTSVEAARRGATRRQLCHPGWLEARTSLNHISRPHRWLTSW